MKHEYLVVLHASHVADVELQLVATHGVVPTSRFQPVTAANAQLLHDRLASGSAVKSHQKAPRPGKHSAAALKPNGLPAPGGARAGAAAAPKDDAAAETPGHKAPLSACGASVSMASPTATNISCGLGPGTVQPTRPPSVPVSTAASLPLQESAQQQQQQQQQQLSTQPPPAVSGPPPSPSTQQYPPRTPVPHQHSAPPDIATEAATAAAAAAQPGPSAHGTAAQLAGPGPASRDVFALLRHHVKKNRAQMERVFPAGTELTIAQLQKLVQSLLLSRTDEAPLTARELQHVMALLDVDGNQKLSRAEFEEGLKECRDIRAMATQLLEGSQQQALLPEAPAAQLVTVVIKQMAALAVHLAASSTTGSASAAVNSEPAATTSPMGQLAVKELLMSLQPDLGRPFLLCILSCLDLWNLSEEGLFTVDALLAALKLQPFSHAMCSITGQAAAPLPIPKPTSGLPPSAATAGDAGSSSHAAPAATPAQPAEAPLQRADASACSRPFTGLSLTYPTPCFSGEHPQWFTMMEWTPEGLGALEVAAQAHQTTSGPCSMQRTSTQELPLQLRMEWLAELRQLSRPSSPAVARLPAAQDWSAWHSNVITARRHTARVEDMAPWEWPPSKRDSWWPEQWRHTCKWVSSSLQQLAKQLGKLQQSYWKPYDPAGTAGVHLGSEQAVASLPQGVGHASLLLLSFPEGPYRQGQLKQFVPSAQDELSAVLPDLFLPYIVKGTQHGASGATQQQGPDLHLQELSDGSERAPGLPNEGPRDVLLGCSWAFGYVATAETPVGLGDVLQVVLHMPGTDFEAFYLHKVEVFTLSRMQPVKWVAHHQAVLEPGQQLQLQPDPHCWQHWDIAALPGGAAIALHHNPSTGCFTWKDTPVATMAAYPGAQAADHAQLETVNPCAPDALTHDCTQAGRLVYLADVQPSTSHSRPFYSLDDPCAQQAQVQGTECPKAILLHAKGGSSAWQATPLGPSTGGVPVVHLKPEVVFAQYDLQQLLPDRQTSCGRGALLLFESLVALDDRSGQLPGSVRFQVLADTQIVWQSPWLSCSGRSAACQVDISTAATLTLCVESAFAPGGAAVWVDPHVVLLPMQLLASHLGPQIPHQAPVKVAWVEHVATSTMCLVPAEEAAMQPEPPHLGCWYQVTIHLADVRLPSQQQTLLVQLCGHQPGSLGPLTTAWFEIDLGPGSESERSRMVVHRVRRPFLKHMAEIHLKHLNSSPADEVPFLLIEVHADHLQAPAYFAIDGIPNVTTGTSDSATTHQRTHSSQVLISARGNTGPFFQRAGSSAVALTKQGSSGAVQGRSTAFLKQGSLLALSSMNITRRTSFSPTPSPKLQSAFFGLPLLADGSDGRDGTGTHAKAFAPGQAFQVQLHLKPSGMSDGLSFPVQLTFGFREEEELKGDDGPSWVLPPGLWGGSPWTILTCSMALLLPVTYLKLVCKKLKQLEEMLLGIEVLDLGTNRNSLFVPVAPGSAGAANAVMLVPVEQQLYRLTFHHKLALASSLQDQAFCVDLLGELASIEGLPVEIDSADAEAGASSVATLCAGVALGRLRKLQLSSTEGLPELHHAEILNCTTGRSHHVAFNSARLQRLTELTISLQPEPDERLDPRLSYWEAVEHKRHHSMEELSDSDAASRASSMSYQQGTAEQPRQRIGSSGRQAAAALSGHEKTPQLAEYHVVLELLGTAANSWRDVAESVVLVGADQDGSLLRSLPIDLEYATSRFCIEADQRYLCSLQQAGATGSTAGAAAQGSAPSHSQASYQVEVHYSGTCLRIPAHPRQDNDIEAHEAAPHLLVTLHGTHNSSGLLQLGPGTSRVPNAAPFGPSTSAHCFQVATQQALGSVLRVEVQLPASSLVSSLWLERVVVVDPLHSTSRAFPARASLGCHLEGCSASLLAEGCPRLYLLPADAPAFTLTTRHVPELRSINIRHDRPGTSCCIKAVHITVTPTATDSKQGSGSTATQSALLAFLSRPNAASETTSPGLAGRVLSIFKPSAADSDRGDLVDQDASSSGRLKATPLASYCLQPADLAVLARPDGTSSSYRLAAAGVPYIRTFWTAAASTSDLATACYMWPVPPLLHTQDEPDQLSAAEQARPEASVQPATDPETEKYLAEYDAEVLEYQAGCSSIFAVLRKFLKAHPEPLDKVIVFQANKQAPRGVHKRLQVTPRQLQTLTLEQLGLLLGEVLPQVLPRSNEEEVASTSRFITAMVLLDPQADPLAPQNLHLCLKACHTAVKQAASVKRLIDSGPQPVLDAATAPAEAALQQLAVKLLGCSIDKHAAFAALDLDSSKVLDLGELAAGVRQLLPAGVGGCDAALRLVLAYTHLHVDTHGDGYLTLPELQQGLAPFIPDFPLQQLQPSLAAYLSSSNRASSAFDVLRTAVKLHPAGVNSAICRLNAAAAKLGTASGQLPNTGTHTSNAAPSDGAAAPASQQHSVAHGAHPPQESNSAQLPTAAQGTSETPNPPSNTQPGGPAGCGLPPSSNPLHLPMHLLGDLLADLLARLRLDASHLQYIHAMILVASRHADGPGSSAAAAKQQSSSRHPHTAQVHQGASLDTAPEIMHEGPAALLRPGLTHGDLAAWLKIGQEACKAVAGLQRMAQQSVSTDTWAALQESCRSVAGAAASALQEQQNGQVKHALGEGPALEGMLLLQLLPVGTVGEQLQLLAALHADAVSDVC